MTAKDTYLNKVSYCLLSPTFCSLRRYIQISSTKGGRRSFKVQVRCGVFSFVCDSLSLPSFPLSNSLDISWAVPLRYAKQTSQLDVETLMMVKAFFGTCNWYPNSIELIDPLNQIDEAFRYSGNHSFMSLVEYVHLHIIDEDTPEDYRIALIFHRSNFSRIAAFLNNFANACAAHIPNRSCPNFRLTDLIELTKLSVTVTTTVLGPLCHLLSMCIYILMKIH